MESQQFLAALAPALTDADARARFLANPTATLADAGVQIPDWITVTAREGSTPELTITLPALLDSDAQLTEENLAEVAGGLRTCQGDLCDEGWRNH